MYKLSTLNKPMNPCIVCGKDIPMTHAVRIIPGVDGVPIGVQHLYKCNAKTKTTLVQKIKALLGVK